MVDDWEARITEVSKTGCTVDRTDGTNSPVFYSFEEFRDLLKKPNVLFESDYFLVERQELRSTGVADSIRTLSGETDTETIWRYAYVMRAWTQRTQSAECCAVFE
jgi:hypothetical protein